MFDCQAESINGMNCPNGVCTCVIVSRRLLQDSCNLTTRITHSVPADISVEYIPQWATAIVFTIIPVPIPEDPASTDNSLVLIVAASVIVVLAVVIVAVVLYIACRPEETIPVPKAGLLTNLKVL